MLDYIQTRNMKFNENLPIAALPVVGERDVGASDGLDVTGLVDGLRVGGLVIRDMVGVVDGILEGM